MQAYISDRAKDNKSTIQPATCWKALKPYFGTLNPIDIDKALCQTFRDDRLAGGVRLGTVWTDLTMLRTALNWARKSKLIPQAPHVWLPVKPAPREVWLTREEVQRLMDACEMYHVRLFVILAITTGARSEAVLSLTWDRVDLERGQVDLRVPGRTVTLKGRAIVPVNATLRSALSDAKRGALSEHVIEWNGRAVASVRTGFEAARERAGLSHITAHDLRRTAARWMAEAGVPMSEISQFLGHSSETVTSRVYARFSVGHLAKAAAALEIGMYAVEVKEAKG